MHKTDLDRVRFFSKEDMSGKYQLLKVAALLEVCFFGAFLCDKALPADVLDVLLVDLLLSVFEALEAAFFPVTFLFFLFPMFFSY
jgi:hypothetical protein